LKNWKQLAVMLLAAVWLLNFGYGFEGSFTRLREYRFLSQSLGGRLPLDQRVHQRRNRFEHSWGANIPIPLPKNYVLGIDYVKREFENKMQSYLRGEWQLGGWCHYYLYACLTKVPLGTWLLGLLAVGMTVWECRGKQRRNKDSLTKPLLAAASDQSRVEGAATHVTWRDEIVLLAPAVAVFVLVSSQTGFNHHLRYVLPAFPFLFIWVSKVGSVFERARHGGQAADEGGRTNGTLTPALSQRERGRWTKAWRTWLMRGIVAGALGWSVVSSLAVYPHSLSYFNELVGGPKNGHWHLGSSNTDWGQDLLYLKNWYDEHSGARPVHLAYALQMFDPVIVGIDYEQVPAGPVMNRPGAPKTANWPWGDLPVDPDLPAVDSSVDPTELAPFPGWYCLSVNQIHRLAGDYEYFLEFEPVDWIGYSMMVFHITVEEANRVRRKLGLPELEENDE
jgi:hypothetical protein